MEEDRSQGQSRFISGKPGQEPEEWEPGEEEYYEEPEGRNVLYWVGGVLLVLAAALAFFLWGQDRGRQATPAQAPATAATAPGAAVETPAAAGQMKGLDERLARLEQGVKDLQGRLGQLEKSSNNILAGQKELSEKISTLGRMTSVGTAPPAAAKPAMAAEPAEAKPAARPAKAANSGSTRKATAKASARTYTVRSGETLFGIAKKNGLTLTQIKKLNGLKSDTIQPGQKLKVK